MEGERKSPVWLINQLVEWFFVRDTAIPSGFWVTRISVMSDSPTGS